MQIVSLGDNCMKCQIHFSWENETNVISLSSAEFSNNMVRVDAFEKSRTFINYGIYLSTLWANAADDKSMIFYFSYFYQKM